MKILLPFTFLIVFALPEKACSNKKSNAGRNCYKGRLEIKAACMNYTISIKEGKIDTSLIVADWTDESTGKSYQHVFELGSKCNFPSDIKEGDEFYFEIDSTVQQNCAVCMLYYPVPPKALAIKVIKEACKP